MSLVATGTAAAYEIPIHVPFAIAKETRPSASLALVTLTDDDGRCGVGECAPFPSLTGDDVKSAVAVAKGLAASMGGKPPLAALAWLSSRKAEVWSASTTAYVGVEMALWDLHARQLGRPLASLWGDASGDTLMTDITLPIMAPEAVAGFWARFQGHGFKLVKIKVSGRVDEDYALVRALVAIAPPGTRVTLDGNQGFGEDGARRLLARLEDAGVRPLFFEQPLPKDDHTGLLALQGTTRVPVCLDESVLTAAEARAWVNQGWRGIFNIKIMKSTIAGAREIISVARAAGVPLMIGGMLESEFAMAASLHLACGTGAITYADLDTPFFFATPVAADSPWQARSALLKLPRGAGHGLSVRA